MLAIMQPCAVASASSLNGTGVANLATPDPKEVWAITGNANVILDLGRKHAVDCVFLMGHFPVGWQWAVAIGDASDGSDAVLAVSSKLLPMSRIVGAMAKDFVQFATKRGRYVTISIVAAYGSAAVPGDIGIALVGRAFVPTYGREWGTGRGLVDTGSRERLIGGGFGLQTGARKGNGPFVLGDLFDAEVDQLYAMLHGIGETGPMVFVEEVTPPVAPSLVARANVSIAGTVVTKSGGIGGNWDASAVSDRGFQNKALAICVPQVASKDSMFGLSQFPLADDSFGSIDNALFMQAANTAIAYESGTSAGATTGFAAGQVLSIAYDEGAVRYTVNGTLTRTVTDSGLGRTLSLDTSLNSNGAQIALTFFGADGFSEGIHYGLFDRIAAYERQDPAKNKWALSLEEWV